MAEFYRKRWGAETFYRVKKDLRAKTTSKNYAVRFFYFMFSVLLYNLSVIVTILIGLSLFGILPEKPLVTAKLFCFVMYSISSDEERG